MIIETKYDLGFKFKNPYINEISTIESITLSKWGIISYKVDNDDCFTERDMDEILCDHIVTCEDNDYKNYIFGAPDE